MRGRRSTTDISIRDVGRSRLRSRKLNRNYRPHLPWKLFFFLFGACGTVLDMERLKLPFYLGAGGALDSFLAHTRGRWGRVEK